METGEVRVTASREFVVRVTEFDNGRFSAGAYDSEGWPIAWASGNFAYQALLGLSYELYGAVSVGV